MILVWMLWRSRVSSQVSVIFTINQGDKKGTISPASSRPSTSTSHRSVSPLINYSYEQEHPYDKTEPVNVETSVSTSTLNDTIIAEEETRRMYTLKEIDKICMEPLNSSKVTTSSAKKINKHFIDKETFDYLPTKSFSCDSSHSQRSSCRGSSGYGSSNSSSTPKR